MKKSIYPILIVIMLLPLEMIAQSFTYNYRGIDFTCKIKKGTTIITGFDTDAAKVIIPAEVKDKHGQSHQVSVLDFFSEARFYKTNTVAIEQGITEIEEYCFYLFKELANVYIPGSIEKIGKKAFNGKYAPTFTMPSNIKESDLLAGNAIYPQASEQLTDHWADLDMSAYVDAPSSLPQKGNAATEIHEQKEVGITPGTSDIDYNIPTGKVKRENTFCIIIANENYKQKDTPNVKYAIQDGKTFQNYCFRTLGLPRDNVRLAMNASYLQTKELLRWMQQIADVYGKDANFLVYYAGHGVPDEKGNCMLIPADVSINDVNNGFSLKELYATLGELTTNNVLLLIDACFSGNDREDVAAVDEMHRGIVREVKNEIVTGNVVVLTAASNTETALSYEEKAHGMFSYYIMKKLQETEGDVTIGELYNYVKKEVMRKSTVVKGKKQTPSVSFSSNLGDNWKNLKL